ncbi:hypothetical protein CMEL01_08118, partial [Colletotrichum melonis]
GACTAFGHSRSVGRNLWAAAANRRLATCPRNKTGASRYWVREPCHAAAHHWGLYAVFLSLEPELSPDGKTLSTSIKEGPFATCLSPKRTEYRLDLLCSLDVALAQAWLGVASPWMQRKGACSNITDANFIAILQQGIGYQVYRETGGDGPCTHKYLWIHSQVEVLCLRLRLCPRDSCMCEPHCPKPQAKVFPFFFFHTPNSCLQLLLAGAACQVLAFLYGFQAASRPCGPYQSSICAATHATSNIKLVLCKSDSLVGKWRWLTLILELDTTTP